MQLRGLTGFLLLSLLHFHARTAGPGLLLQRFPLHFLWLCCQTHDSLGVAISAQNSSLEGFFPMTEPGGLCPPRLLPAPRCAAPLPTHSSFTVLSEKGWRMKCVPNPSQTSRGPVISDGFRKVCAGTWCWKGQLSHWAAAVTLCLVTSREDSDRAVRSL